MHQILQHYIAHTFECTPALLGEAGLHFVESRQPARLQLLAVGDATFVCASPAFLPDAKAALMGKTRDEVFEYPLVYGQTIGYAPDLSRAAAPRAAPADFAYALFDGNAHTLPLTAGFENALTFAEGRCVSDIACCALANGQVVAAAGADRRSQTVWEVGVEVAPPYRRRGLAAHLMGQLTTAILSKGVVPIWRASVTNIASQAAALRCGYTPLWVESFGHVYDHLYAHKAVLQTLSRAPKTP